MPTPEDEDGSATTVFEAANLTDQQRKAIERITKRDGKVAAGEAAFKVRNPNGARGWNGADL